MHIKRKKCTGKLPDRTRRAKLSRWGLHASGGIKHATRWGLRAYFPLPVFITSIRKRNCANTKEMDLPIFNTRVGSFQPLTGEIEIYLDDCKSRVNQSIDDLSPLGHISSVEDCVVPLVGTPSLADINREIIVTRDKKLESITCPTKVICRPSETIDSVYNSALTRRRLLWASHSQAITMPLSTVGMRLQTSSGKTLLVYNRTGHATFNPYNSQLVSFEVHRNMDLLMLMVAFLKHNGVWGGSNALMKLSRFDYVGAFFDSSWVGASSCSVHDFSRERVQLAAAYERCVRDISSTASGASKRQKRTVAVTDERVLQYVLSSINKHGGCTHDPRTLHVSLDKGYKACIGCFCEIFFVPPFQVRSSSIGIKAAQDTIDGWLSRGQELMMAASGAPTNVGYERHKKLQSPIVSLAKLTSETLGPLGTGRDWNWPTKGDANMVYEYVTHTLAHFIDAFAIRAGRTLSGKSDMAVLDMDPSLLYFLMNPFGRMLLLTIENAGVVSSPLGDGTSRLRGRFFEVVFPTGSSVWSFQITSIKTVPIEVKKSGCLETCRQLPFDASDRCPKRIVYKAFCRGETVASAESVISDVTQSVVYMTLLLDNREFYVNRDTGAIASSAVLTDTIVSLEVTGYHPVRVSSTKNRSRVSGRMLQLLRTRVGGRLWYSPLHEAIILEDLSTSSALSAEATARATKNNRVFYYDIETTGLDPLDENALITAICGTLSTGGDVNRGERAVFGLATKTGTPRQLMEELKKCYSKSGPEPPHLTDTLPDTIHTHASEIELLIEWGRYMRRRNPHITSGWNSSGFDDFYVFATIVRYLYEPPGGVHLKPSRASTAKQRLELARGGMYDFTAFVDQTTGYLHSSVGTALWTMIKERRNTNIFVVAPNTSANAKELLALMGSLATCLRLDMMVVCAKAYRDQLPEFTLNAMMIKVSKEGKKDMLIKDPIDIKYHLMDYTRRTPDEQAKVLRYCSKDAHLVAIVSSDISKEGEIFQLCQESELSVAPVVDHLDRPLCIIEGALHKSMGPERTARKGCGIRRHSLATDTKGGMVAQPLVEQAPCQTVDLSSLYPSLMHDNNLCITTYVTHGQVVELRNRRVWAKMREMGVKRPNLTIMDAANAEVLARYHPVDIITTSWLAVRPVDGLRPSRLERELGFCWWPGGLERRRPSQEEWCANRSPNMSIRSAGLDYIPEVPCNEQIQMAAFVNDDAHVSIAGLEYLVTVLPILAWESKRVTAHVTAGECLSAEQLWAKMEEDFDAESDGRIQQSHGTFVGGDTGSMDHGIRDPVAYRLKALKIQHPDKFHRLVVLCDRIARRVNAYDSARDEAVVRWATRMFDVGSYCRTWNVAKNILPGVIPSMQLRYRAQRVDMKRCAKKYRTTDPILADMNDVREKVLKTNMNSIYGVLALRSHTQTEVKDLTWHDALSFRQLMSDNAAGGVGGGTQHTPMANQITQLARRVFPNIGASLRQCLPNVKQVYGDTDSTFLVHNIPGDGNDIIDDDQQRYLLVDLHLKVKLAKLIPAIINACTKGIARGSSETGSRMMNIEHERISLITHIAAKKAYHMLHLNEASPTCKALIDGIGRVNETPDCTHPFPGNVGNIVKVVSAPSSARGYVVPHNPELILRLAAESHSQQLAALLRTSGVCNKASLGRWLESSSKWILLDLEAIRNLYATKMLDTTEWLSASTARVLDIPVEIERVAAAAEICTVYKKGPFVKKGIVSATKLKNLQATFDRADVWASTTPSSLSMRETYERTIKKHAQNCASFEVDPTLATSTARVRTLREVRQNLPNPAAMVIHNHLNPLNKIDINEKFVCVAAVSGWALSTNDERVPAGYYTASAVRWNPERMMGLIAGNSVRNLSVVANTVKSVYDMVAADEKVLASMCQTIREALLRIESAKGFAVYPGALSYGTGILVADVVARSIILIAEGNRKVETIVSEAAGLSSKDAAADQTIARPRSTVADVDQRVKIQLDTMWQQFCVSKSILKKDAKGGSILDRLVAAVNVDPARLLEAVAERMLRHEKQCPAIGLEATVNDETVVAATLKVLGGFVKCTATCVAACCQALDFVLLYCVLLKLENKRIQNGQKEQEMLKTIFFDKVEMARVQNMIKACRTNKLVPWVFGSKYNRDANAVVYLFDSLPHYPISGMSAKQLVEAVTDKQSGIVSSRETGIIWNINNENFFGRLLSATDSSVRLAESGIEQQLPFFTGVYHAPVLELMAGMLGAVYVRARCKDGSVSSLASC